LTTSCARPKAALACGYIKSGGSAAIGAHDSAALAAQLDFQQLVFTSAALREGSSLMGGRFEKRPYGLIFRYFRLFRRAKPGQKQPQKKAPVGALFKSFFHPPDAPP
ncbi:MAG: hypothetical protein K2G07_10095, partial [Muribaculaceae bacterium]|nr:hypothetical protein [Muribaculaceae bacterium]